MKGLKNFELATYDVEELNRQEMMNADGGGYWYDWEYRWSGTDNPIRYACEAVENGIIAVHNGIASVANWLQGY